jgi:transcriptional regulator with XRE-family HTH domain
VAKQPKRRPIHARIAALRAEKGLSQRDLAKIVGVDETAVSHWETGSSAPNGRRLPIVAQALGVTIDELFQVAKAS